YGHRANRHERINEFPDPLVVGMKRVRPEVMFQNSGSGISVRMTIPGDMLFFLDHAASKSAFRQNSGDH
ncbi:MAG: hypothetical protein WBC86_02845, partial [Pseudolabrys sp.]